MGILDLESQEIVYKHKTWLLCFHVRSRYMSLCSFQEFAGAQAIPEKVILHWRTANKRHGKNNITGGEENLYWDDPPRPGKFCRHFRDATVLINCEMKKLGFEANKGITSNEFWNLTIHPDGKISGKKTYTRQH